MTAGQIFASRRLANKLDRLLHDARAAWCARFGPPLEIVSDAPAVLERVSLRPPSRTVWENPLEEAFYGPGEGRAVVEHPEATLYRLANVFVTGSEGLLFAGPRTLLRFCASQNDIAQKKMRRPIARLARRIDGAVLPLGGRGVGNRGHFLCEHLPRLMLAREHLGNELPFKVLVTPGHRDWQAEYLGRVGEDPNEVVEGSRGTVYCPQAWFVPNLSATERADLYQPDVYREIARRFKDGLAPGGPKRRLFLTRRDAHSRRLHNEDEVYTLLRGVWPDLERISLAGMHLREQIALFLGARVVVGPHSQTFRNLLYCEGALSIQLVPGHRTAANAYGIWADNYDRLGLIHANRCLSLYGEEPYRDGDWSFPIDRLRSALRRLSDLGEVHGA